MEERRSVCKNPWCKATFIFTENDMEIVEGCKSDPIQCKKCKSFSKDLSGGVEWKEKEYEGSRYDGLAHETKYKVSRYK